MRVAVVGAGVAGLTVARQLASHHDVIVFDKGRSVGGRMATRRIGEATFDHGAQFFTARTPEFQACVDDWIRRGVVREWCRGFGERPDGFPRYIGTAGMNSVAKDLAIGLDVRLHSMVFTIRSTVSSVRRLPVFDLVTDDGAAHRVDRVVLTCPILQSRALLIQPGFDLPELMTSSDYARTLAALLVLDSPSSMPPPGAAQFPPGTHEVLGFVADNQCKGVSAAPAITIHANDRWSVDWWKRSNHDVLDELIAAARPWIGDAAVKHAEVKRWRLATPLQPWPEACWTDPSQRVVLAGDFFAGPKVEGAYRSGLAASVVVGTGA